ncbi:MAG: alpha/beta hydrolase [Isosphaeraceae bacterium]
MTYRILGEGPPLVLVPGIASTYRGYCPTLSALASRFQTIVYDYPGDQRDDGALLSRISHDQLVDDLFGLIEHLNLGRVFLFGLSFGSTITLAALAREPRRFPKAVVQGAFAHRKFTLAERAALWMGRRMPGTASRLPLHEPILRYNNAIHFAEPIVDRWPLYVEQNGLTPIAALSHRLDLVSRLDLRPLLGKIKTEILLLQGNEDRIVPQRYFDELRQGLPQCRPVIMPMVGHQPHYTHPEALAQAVGDWLLPCMEGGCPTAGRT